MISREQGRLDWTETRKNVGLQLQNFRTAKFLSIEEVADKTAIYGYRIEALECGKTDFNMGY